MILIENFSMRELRIEMVVEINNEERGLLALTAVTPMSKMHQINKNNKLLRSLDKLL